MSEHSRVDQDLPTVNLLNSDAMERPRAIMTPGLFPLMNCPAEIRVKVWLDPFAVETHQLAKRNDIPSR
jgi:hypothetical protein